MKDSSKISSKIEAIESNDSKSNNYSNGPKPNPVYLNIYNFWHCFNTCCPCIGVYHTGIEIYEDQYMYYGFEGDQTGVGWIQPKTAAYQFTQQILLGHTTYSYNQTDQHVLEPLRMHFTGNRYDLLNNNCNHFSHRFAEMLQLSQKFPEKINRMTNCVNLFRCCIPQCILNGRLDWFSSKKQEEQKYIELKQELNHHQGPINNQGQKSNFLYPISDIRSSHSSKK